MKLIVNPRRWRLPLVRRILLRGRKSLAVASRNRRKVIARTLDISAEELRIIREHELVSETASERATFWLMAISVIVPILIFLGLGNVLLKYLVHNQIDGLLHGVAAGAVFMFIPLQLMRYPISKNRVLWTCAVCGAAGSLLLYMLRDLIDSKSAYWLMFLAGSVGYIGFICAIITLMILIVRTGLMLISRNAKQIRPEAVLVGVFAQLLEIAITSKHWSIPTKSKLLEQLEEAAVVLAVFIPRHLHTSDPDFDIWMRERAQRHAASIRELKKWVYTPQAGTREKLIGEISLRLRPALYGLWHEFPEADPMRNSVSRYGRQLLQVAQTLLNASIPLVLLYLWRLTPIAPAEPLFEKLVTAAFVVSGVYLVLGLDPKAGERMSTAASLLKAFAGKS